MTQEELWWCQHHYWYREHKEIGTLLTPLFRVRVNIDGLLVWYDDIRKLRKDMNI